MAINHKDQCSHAQTPKARKACRKATKAGLQAMQARTAKRPNVVSVRGGKVHAGYYLLDGDLFAACRTGSQDSGRTRYQGTEAPITCRACGA